MKQQNICPTTRDRTHRPQHVSTFSCVKRKEVKNPETPGYIHSCLSATLVGYILSK